MTSECVRAGGPGWTRPIVLGRRAARAALAALAALACTWTLSGWVPAAQAQDWPLFGRDVERTSASPDGGGLTAGSVADLRRQQVTIDGTVDASVIYLHGVSVKGATHDVLFVTTTYGKTIALDARSGTTLWEYTPPSYADLAGTYRITNATPAADPDREFIYAGAPDGLVRKLAIADGHEVWHTAVTRLPEREKIASPLTVFHGRVIAVVGGYVGDRPPYQGHVAVLDAAAGRLLHVWNALCSDQHALLDPSGCRSDLAAIWGRAGAVIDPATGSIFVATGNGPWNGHTDWGDATVELDSAANLVGNWAPTDQADLERTDLDIGSTSPVLLSGAWVAQGGKDGLIRLLDWTRMRGSAPHMGGETQTVPTPAHTDLFTAPAVWHDGGAIWMFVADGGGTEAWKLTDAHQLVSAWRNGNAGTSPVVAGGLLYVYDPGGHLRVYDATTGREAADLSCGGGHWNSPIVADGMVVEPEGNANRHATRGVIDIWRR